MGHNESLARFGADFLSGHIKVVDLAQTLSSDFPVLQLPPELGQVCAFKQETISRYDEKAPGWYWNNFSCGEHPAPTSAPQRTGSPASTTRTTPWIASISVRLQRYARSSRWPQPNRAHWCPSSGT